MKDWMDKIIPLCASAILGGAVTYAVQRLLFRRPKLKWRILPHVEFPSKGLTAFNVLLRNDGKAAAKDVRAVIGLPEGTQLQATEIQPSESALSFTKGHSSGRQMEIKFPNFQAGVECVIGLLVQGTSVDELAISIAGDDVLGKKEVSFTSAYVDTFMKAAMGVFAALILILIFLLSGMFIKLTELRVTSQNFEYRETERYVADFYMSVKNYATALKHYQASVAVGGNNLSARYGMAVCLAKMKDAPRAVRVLDEMHELGALDAARFALTDPAFDDIAQSPDFMAYKMKHDPTQPKP